MPKNSNSINKSFEETAALFGENAVMLEELYREYIKNPNLVDKSWHSFFGTFSEKFSPPIYTTAKVLGINAAIVGEELAKAQQSKKNTKNIDCSIGFKELPRNDYESSINTQNISESAINVLLNAYRSRGHFVVKLDPLDLEKLPTKQDIKLNIESLGLNINADDPALKKLALHLDNIYCSNIGAEFSHITNYEEQGWLFEEFETKIDTNYISTQEKKSALETLAKAEGFEQFLHTKFPGAKRFSVEGGEGTILALERIVKNFAKTEGLEIIIGMAHRGRLNTLANVIDKPYKAILSEFLGTPSFPSELNVAGDVKYHMGFSSNKTIDGNNINLSLAANPSHLEAVNSVVAGRVRAKQDLLSKTNASSTANILGILIHGDAAFCGQGVVAENIVSSHLKAYDTQGIIHIIINNQIGFTADADDAHSGRYVTEVAKISGAPILHVNGDDAENILKAADFALNYRNKFCKDIVLDIVCYRKYGHNEGDEPFYTQSIMYKAISAKQTPATIYASRLVNENIIASDFLENFKKTFKELLDKEYISAKAYKPNIKDFDSKFNKYSSEIPTTGLNQKLLKDLCAKLCTVPQGFGLHPKLKTLLDQRLKDIQDDKPIDWATAETIAYASLLTDKKPVRLVGQDSARGTFSHRHSVLYDQENGKRYFPLNNLSNSQASYFVADSNLTEYAALGFEYGYSTVNFNCLVIWEAQFGDFANGAQIIIDQFISSGKTKWLQDSNLVMLLPHGYEGQGPEHSSARLERFLSIAAENNMRIAYPTTPASIFHLLRGQVYSKDKLPLIIMSPKSLLRHKLAVSTLADIDEGSKFFPVLDDARNNLLSKNIKKVICCTGKIYYDLLEAAIQNNIEDTTIIRFEQIYPFSKDDARNIINKYDAAKEFIWAQEEPKNMGAWSFIEQYLNDSIGKSFRYVGRETASSPACGYLYMHNNEQKELIKSALNLN